MKEFLKIIWEGKGIPYAKFSFNTFESVFFCELKVMAKFCGINFNFEKVSPNKVLVGISLARDLNVLTLVPIG